jgi:hypothetical protein
MWLARHRETERDMRQTTEPASTRVVKAVARSRGVDVTDLPPLHDVVDTEALDALFGPRLSGEPRPEGITVRFSYAGRDVVVRSESGVEVGPSDATCEPSATD